MMDHDAPQYARHGFAQEMSALEHDLIDMASRAESMVRQAAEALEALDSNLALEVIRRDDEIDERDLAIEQQCLKLLALQQPMASDLRTVGTAMKMITDIERIGDLSVDIAKTALKIEKELGVTSYVDIPRIALLARNMLKGSMEAFVRRDLELVDEVCKQDDEVDQLYRELRSQIHATMQNEPDQVVAASWLLLAVHHFERIADHAVNIAERVAFMVTGNLVQIATSHKSDSTEA